MTAELDVLKDVATACWSNAGMRETTPEVRQLLVEGYRALRPEQRVRMCAELFESARLLIEASLPAGLDDVERRRRVCRRLYGKALAGQAFPEVVPK